MSFPKLQGHHIVVRAPLLWQDYLQFGSLARIVGGQLARRPQDIVAMTIFMRSAKAGQMFASQFALLGVYAALHRLSQLVGPAHCWLLQPFPGLLFRWKRLVSAQHDNNLKCGWVGSIGLQSIETIGGHCISSACHQASSHHP